MPVYSALTILIFCTDKSIKYFIDKTDPDGFLENCSGLVWPFCVTRRTVVDHVGGNRVQTGSLGGSGPIGRSADPSPSRHLGFSRGVIPQFGGLGRGRHRCPLGRCGWCDFACGPVGSLTLHESPVPVTSEPCPRGESVRLRTPQAAGGPVDPGAESLCRLLSRASETPSVRSTCGSFLRTASRPVASCGKPARPGRRWGPLCSAPFWTRSVGSDTTSFPSASLSDWAARGLTPPSSSHARPFPLQTTEEAISSAP